MTPVDPRDSSSKTALQLIERLYLERNEVEHLLCVFAKKGDENKNVLGIGMSVDTDLSWFLRAKEWVTWFLYRLMTANDEASAFIAQLNEKILENVELPPGRKPS